MFSLHLKKAVQKDSCSQVPRAHAYFASPVNYFLCEVKIFRGTTFRVSKFDFPYAKFLLSRVNDAACCAIRTNAQIPSAPYVGKIVSGFQGEARMKRDTGGGKGGVELAVTRNPLTLEARPLLCRKSGRGYRAYTSGRFSCKKSHISA